MVPLLILCRLIAFLWLLAKLAALIACAWATNVAAYAAEDFPSARRAELRALRARKRAFVIVLVSLSVAMVWLSPLGVPARSQASFYEAVTVTVPLQASAFFFPCTSIAISALALHEKYVDFAADRAYDLDRLLRGTYS